MNRPLNNFFKNALPLLFPISAIAVITIGSFGRHTIPAASGLLIAGFLISLFLIFTKRLVAGAIINMFATPIIFIGGFLVYIWLIASGV